MPISESYRPRVIEKLRLIYGEQAETTLRRIDAVADKFSALRECDHRPRWNERTAILITYGDQVRGATTSAIEAQRQFLVETKLDEVINTVHLLPFSPYSSDDGFSVIDYRRVNSDVGEWDDVRRMSASFGLMFDFVVNHCSQQNEWFQRYLRGDEPYTNFFIDVDPAIDLSAVTRPRSSPLLTPFETERGTKHVWTTFSADQIDLNFACPDLLIEALDILLTYIERGATLIRLDAIGFLWKQIGTTCMHLPETHAVVKLMRDVVDDLAPGTLLVTETNVPHTENVSYFGDGDEAHMVYQFSLAPLLLDAFLIGDASALNGWLSGLAYPGDGMTFFNFTASHDGIGVRPLEGLVSSERVEALAEAVRQRGGRVSMRRRPDGSESPYELNITYLSALDTPDGLPVDLLARKFLTSQAIMLALRGIPGIYFHSLVGTRNYEKGVQQTDHNRTINRRKFDIDELQGILTDEESLQRQVLDGYRQLLETRISQPAFHPDASQTMVETGHKSLLTFARNSCDGSQRIYVVANLSDEPVILPIRSLGEPAVTTNLISGQPVLGGALNLQPFEIAWLT